jgi:two-component system, OmpR family, phosphate regulon sensor histidine kinase PhoR
MARGDFIARLDERRILRWLALFFLALAVPALVLVWHTWNQLNWQAFRQAQLVAEELAVRVDAGLVALMQVEEARGYGDYAFLIVEGDPDAEFVQRSPLSALPVEGSPTGLIGYFQVNADGELSTPLLPSDDVDPQAWGISAAERERRLAVERSLRDVLASNGLVPPGPGLAAAPVLRVEPRACDFAPPQADESDDTVVLSAGGAAGDLSAQAAFDRLSDLQSAAPGAGVSAMRVEAQRIQTLLTDVTAPRRSRTERTALPEVSVEARRDELAAFASEPPDATVDGFRVSTFASEIDPFEISLLDSGHLLMFRKVWRDGERHIQGAVIDRQPFLTATVGSAFLAGNLARSAELLVLHDRRPQQTFRSDASSTAATDAGVPLYQARLSPPFSAFELNFALLEAPRGPGGLLLGWVTIALVAVLVAGFWLMYRFALGQLRLARQQQDFVSAVSHELKTPLTSIRMYGEMLKAGWTDETRRSTYYDYIHAESERLSRLIDNVLQLARMTRRELTLKVEPVTAGELMDLIRSKVGAQVERAGFDLAVATDPACTTAELPVDRDAFAQIMINLVDNALKYSAAAAPRRVVELGCRRERDGAIVFTVRDHGPGVPRAQMKRIFELFYRPGDALTRETAGTGIGLALVRQLASAMGAQVDVRNVEPGAEFSLRFAVAA